MELQHLFRPSRHPNRDKIPALVLLHGMGGHKTDLMSLASILEPTFSVLSVRAPLSMPEGGHSWYGVRFAPDPVIDSAQAEASRLLVIEFLHDAVQRYNLEPSSIFLAGFSQGAIIAASVALMRPELLAGMVMMSGRILPEVKTQGASAKLEQLNVFVAHGRDDQRLPIFHAHETRDWLEGLGVKLTYREYAGGHEIGTDENRDVAQWLLELVART
jgi:phospholipase/carboxylesterase